MFRRKNKTRSCLFRIKYVYIYIYIYIFIYIYNEIENRIIYYSKLIQRMAKTSKVQSGMYNFLKMYFQGQQLLNINFGVYPNVKPNVTI